AEAAYRAEATAYIGDHLGRVPVVAAARLGRTFGVYDPVGQVDLDRVEGRPKGLAVAGLLTFYATAALAVVGWRRLRRAGWSWAALAPLWGPIALVAVTVVAFYGTTRFRAVAELSFILLAAVGLTGARPPERAPVDGAGIDAHEGHDERDEHEVGA
ncbi:MAG: glycosyl transferase, partial [Acidimicrobiia bacterium]|nr:glycosyl transferase [Acidimicrobiia bacterium]